MKLSELCPGERAMISEIGQLDLPQTVKRKLLSMGITPNTFFTFIRRAPMGSGIELALRGSKLCMRKELADLIEVTKTEVINAKS